ncbi:MAG TPA: PIG-L family deacetylase, partial [Thermoanaerobaculia bacterium]|nr:PIG-L family deacetylase [Thermoanaerobaculia bacterium]
MTETVEVLAVGAHPDDVELGCGGTLALLARAGRSVGILDLTRGEAGTRGTPETRAAEAAESARILGARFRDGLDLGDGLHRQTPARNR